MHGVWSGASGTLIKEQDRRLIDEAEPHWCQLSHSWPHSKCCWEPATVCRHIVARHCLARTGPCCQARCQMDRTDREIPSYGPVYPCCHSAVGVRYASGRVSQLLTGQCGRQSFRIRSGEFRGGRADRQTGRPTGDHPRLHCRGCSGRRICDTGLAGRHPTDCRQCSASGALRTADRRTEPRSKGFARRGCRACDVARQIGCARAANLPRRLLSR